MPVTGVTGIVRSVMRERVPSSITTTIPSEDNTRPAATIPINNNETYKVYANGRNVRLGVRIVGKSKQQTRLSNTRVTNEQQLEEVIAER